MKAATDSDVECDGIVVVVPVKPPAHAKSRLGVGSDDARRSLATAFALDTVHAAAGAAPVRAVLVVTDDVPLAGRLARQGHSVMPDGGSDLNDLLVQAAAEAGRRWPGSRPVVLLADLPCLRTEDLAGALVRLPPRAAFVRDRHGTGTTLYAAAVDGAFRPRFGPDSAAAHLAEGAQEIEVLTPGLRLDVDDADDLADALALGVGPHTAAACAAL